MKISELITDKYKLRIPPTVYYELLADVVEVEEEQEPTTKNDLGVDCISRKAVLELLEDTNNGWIINEVLQLPSKTPQEPTDNDVVLTYDMYHDLIADRAGKLEQELVLDKIRAEIKREKLEDSPNFCVKAHNNAVDRVLGIIDKYKAETEDT